MNKIPIEVICNAGRKLHKFAVGFGDGVYDDAVYGHGPTEEKAAYDFIFVLNRNKRFGITELPETKRPAITKELKKAIAHVKKFHPTVAIVVFTKDGRWRYMDEDFTSFKFAKKIDVSILERASDSIQSLPFVYQIEGA